MNRTLVALLSVTLLVGLPARAEEKKDDSIPGFGLGVGMGIGNAYSGGSPATPPVSVYATFNLGESFRLEPNFGYWVISKGSTLTVGPATLTASDGGYAVQVGLGGFYVMRPVRPLAVYGGARLGMVFAGGNSVVDAVNVTLSGASIYFNPTLGLEWSIVRAFSIGAEAQIALRWYLAPTITAGSLSTTASAGKFGSGVEAIVFMRVYL
jgi:hypothetical protein